MDFGLLAPAIIGAVVGVLGLGVLLWMNHNRPSLEIPVSEAPSEEKEQARPFEDEAERQMTPENRLLYTIIYGRDLTTAPSLTSLPDEAGRVKVIRRRADQSADR